MIRRIGLPLFCCMMLLWSVQARAAISFVSATTANPNANASTITVNVPASIQAGDLLVATLVTADNSLTFTQPAGWALVSGATNPASTTAIGGMTQMVAYKFATAAEPASYTWTISSSTKSTAAIVAYREVDRSSPFNGFAVTIAAAASATVSAPSVTTSVPNSVVLRLLGIDSGGGGTISAPTGTTSRATISLQANPGTTVQVADATQATAGASGIASGTASTSAINVGYTLALRPALLAAYRMEESGWSGVAGEVADNALNGYDATADRLNSSTGYATTANTSPALTGDPGTCRYGVFNGTTQYLALPSSFPNLATDFTITAWIRSTSLTNAAADVGQRIFLDDESNSSGFGFSLNDSGGRSLRFFSRAISPVILDSSVSLVANTWYFVAAVADITNRRRSIYVYNQAGTLVNVTSDAANFTGTWGTDAGIASIGGETKASSETTPGFHFRGNLDWVRVYRNALPQAQLTQLAQEKHVCIAAPSIDHFGISIGSSAASTCSPKSITITAYDSANTVLTGYTGTINLSTSTNHGDWDKSGVTLAGSGTDNGAGSYTFTSGDAGVVSLNLSNTHADNLSITVVDSAVASTSTTSGTINFRDNAFVIDSPSGTPSAAWKDTWPANRTLPFTVSLYNRDISTGNCSVNTKYQGAKTLDAWLTLDAAHPLGAAAPSIGATSLSSTAASVSLTFTLGVATANLATTDVGKYALNLRDATRIFATGVDISGASATQTLYPFALVVNNILAGATVNPATSSAVGAVFTRAGSSFQATASAYRWSSAADANNDNVPDVGASLAQITANGRTPAFAWATTLSGGTPYYPATPADTPPGTGVAGSISGGALLGSAFSSGQATVATLAYSEVGSFSLAPSVTSYLNNTNVDLNSSNGNALVFDSSGVRNRVVGRFTPDHFVLGASTLTNRADLSCATSTFTYLGEPLALSYTLVAQNVGNATTQNYAGAYAKLDGATASKWTTIGSNDSIGLGAANVLAPLTALTSRVSISGTPSGVWTSGSGVLNANIVVGRNGAAVDGPFTAATLGIAPKDSDGISLLSAALNFDADLNSVNERQSVGSSILRYGRARLFNAHGSELLPLAVPLVMQYYNGFGFVANAADSCTTFTLTPGICGVASCAYTDLSLTQVTVGKLAANQTTPSLSVSPVASGLANLNFTAPGATRDGALDLSLNVPAWLEYNWTGAVGDPKSRATFGIHRKAEQFIYQRENY